MAHDTGVARRQTAGGNPRTAGVEARASKFPGPSLIPELNAIQSRLGWLPRAELEALARRMRRPLYEIEGLISSYPHFGTEAPAMVALHACRDLSCWLAGSAPDFADQYGPDVELRPARATDADALVADTVQAIGQVAIGVLTARVQR